jgi:hypothetical protein
MTEDQKRTLKTLTVLGWRMVPTTVADIARLEADPSAVVPVRSPDGRYFVVHPDGRLEERESV